MQHLQTFDYHLPLMEMPKIEKPKKSRHAKAAALRFAARHKKRKKN